ncbi:1-(5-phosphoribosyl)-5-[(5-phosphoribosylamino) methylideneamino]imidazole-4-carboxamide isomerase [Schizosaccharomyces octosporus yFS286]|uniref:1-(5-phosphoribosyl)-5-[(5-phosphoribosylamino)methylideneamino] imidazole-4-carboxamide isomerase n=1 Tax=Schizosaccharomyces octosporus (strain yFS286) TaxID=483514 RepID=S9PVM6_SCHOY|nr:1-(5-phosphoribosyl)-5-[(5-phosphoribosylamino) methylideneamino]imidazole-4-carboxamide isomerase [Schizosaccharomyces octosporus yFS286]EPX71533.1 1-(5-phosphoribosyl)-5-[(5-phosphoribosylamino) methylideneamino]imidazole-4-carboxamide isomerase [Schizosaccharomyces octosporus yFS286]
MSQHTLFRPCIDIHKGQVKQIVGGTLGDNASLQTNYVSLKSSDYYAQLYKENHLLGGHVIMLGPNCEETAKTALHAWPGYLQIGGGINNTNAKYWLEQGASKVIVTSWLFPNGQFDLERLKTISDLVGKDRLVVDVSCRRRENGWFAAINKWQTVTEFEISKDNLDLLSNYCTEFLIHAADVEGLCRGIDEELVKKLGEWVTIPTTYAGGGRNIEDLELVNTLSHGKVDLTIGSALDIFGGSLGFARVVAWNRQFAPLSL